MTLNTGDVLGGRYRLRKTEWTSVLGPVWQARDSTLDRDVLIQVLAEQIDASPTARRTFIKAAARTAQVTAPGLLDVFDIGENPSFVVFERPGGGRLIDRLRVGPLRTNEAARITLALARTLEGLHHSGEAHGLISPETVLLDGEMRPRLYSTGQVQTAAAAGGVDPHVEQPTGYRAEPTATPADADRYALAALLFHMLTGQAPSSHGPSARHVRRSVPAEIDSLLTAALSPTPAKRPTVDAFIVALGPFARIEPERARRRRTFDPSEFRWLVPVILIVGVAVLALTLGVGLVKDFASGRRTPTPSPQTTGTTTPPGEALSIEDASDFDPPPGNGEEHSTTVSRAIDGDPRTAWKTLQYSRTSFDGRKKGVGLLFDLGAGRDLTTVRVQTTLEGWAGEIRVSDVAGDNADDFALAKSFTASTDATVTLPKNTKGRYVLLWITQLIDNEGGSNFPYSAEVAEVEFFA